MAYKAGFFIWLAAVIGSLIMGFTASGWFELAGIWYSLEIGVGSTVLFFLYLILIFLYNRSKAAFWIMLATELAALLSFALYIRLS